MPSTVSLANIKYRNRGEANIGSIVSFLIFSTEDLTAEWPKKADVVSGKCAVIPPITAGKIPGAMTPDLDSGYLKQSRKGTLGYQNHSHEGGAKFAGLSGDQLFALESTFNMGIIVIGTDSEGKRWVAGSKSRPLTVEYDSQTGTKVDDAKQIDVKFKGDGYPWPLVELADTVVIPMV